MVYTINTSNGAYRFTYDELLEIAEERILKRHEKNEIDKLFDIVCAYYGVAKSMVLGSSRKQELVEARRVLSYMITEHAGYSLKAAGRILTLDHSTVSYHVNYIKDGIERYAETKRVIDHAKEQFYGKA